MFSKRLEVVKKRLSNRRPPFGDGSGLIEIGFGKCLAAAEVLEHTDEEYDAQSGEVAVYFGVEQGYARREQKHTFPQEAPDHQIALHTAGQRDDADERRDEGLRDVGELARQEQGGLEDEDEYTFSGSSSSNFKLTLASSIKSRYDKVEYVSARKTDGGATIILNIRLVFDKDADMSNAAAPGSVEWSASSEGTATWGDVSSAKYFQVQLYKDGNLVTPPDGSASTVSVYGTSYDFSSWVSSGSKYTFKVRSVKASNNAKSKWVSSSSWTPGSNTSDNNNTNTFPEGWQKAADGIRWWWQNPDGSYPASQWKETDGKWYYFDAEGYMATGWINVGGVDYCLAPDGALYVSCTTPDGYNVDANGAWIH